LYTFQKYVLERLFELYGAAMIRPFLSEFISKQIATALNKIFLKLYRHWAKLCRHWANLKTYFWQVSKWYNRCIARASCSFYSLQSVFLCTCRLGVIVSRNPIGFMQINLLKLCL